MSEVLTKAIEEHGEAIKSFREEVSGEAGEIRQRMTDLEQSVAKGLKHARAVNDDEPAGLVDIKTIYTDPAFQQIKSDNRGTAKSFPLPSLSLKAMVNLATGVTAGFTTYDTPAQRFPGVLGQAIRPIRVLDALPSRPVTSNKIEYVQLNETGEADIQANEGDEKAEAEFSGLLKTANVATVAVHTTLSAQVLDDEQSLQDAINRVLTGKVLTKAEIEIMTGSGAGGHAEGIYTQATLIATTVGEDAAEKIGEAITAMDNVGYTVNVIMLNPSDWFAISIIKDADGNYIYGNPASPAAPSLWNRPIVTSPTVPAGMALIGDTQYVNVLDRMTPTLYISRDHKDYRTRNLVLILVEARLGLELFDVNGFRKLSIA